MVLSGMRKFINAVNKAGIKNWEIYTAPGTCWYNTANSENILLLDDGEEMLINIARRNPAIGNNIYGNANLQLNAANLADVHELRMGCSYEELIKFCDAYGVKLSNDQKRVLINIDKANYRIKPSSGYSPALFVELSDEDISKLSSADRADYYKRKEAFDKSKELPKSAPVHVQV